MHTRIYDLIFIDEMKELVKSKIKKELVKSRIKAKK